MSASIGSSYVGIVDRVVAAADRPTGVRFVGPSVAPAAGERFRAVARDPRRGPGRRRRAAGPGSRARRPRGHPRADDAALITIIQGCWLAGIASMVLPLPMRMGSLEAFIESTRGAHPPRRRQAGADRRPARRLLRAHARRPADRADGVGAAGSTTAPSGERLEIPAHDPERLVILQYTSGSTSEPKGVMIPDRVLAANIDACCEAAEFGESTR